MTGSNTASTPGLTNPPDVDLALQAQLSATNPLDPTFNPDSWRSEVSARLDRYRTRRKPRPPRYPSLLLPFDASENWLRSTRLASQVTPASKAWSSSESALELRGEVRPEVRNEVRSTPEKIATTDLARTEIDNRQIPQNDQSPPNQSAKLIEFPRSAAIPIFRAPELADPIFDRPRIVEAPEILPPPPALGGMLIEAIHKDPVELRTDSPAASVSVLRRAGAAALDGVILASAIAAFTSIFLRFNPVRPPLPIQASALGAVTVLLWMAYEFLLVVYTGSTPGLRIARLQLAAFNGSALDRRTRRWRVLASFLSAFSAGLGYLWCLLDQDGLCWHDRITRTNVQSCGTDSVATNSVEMGSAGTGGVKTGSMGTGSVGTGDSPVQAERISSPPPAITALQD